MTEQKEKQEQQLPVIQSEGAVNHRIVTKDKKLYQLITPANESLEALLDFTIFLKGVIENSITKDKVKKEEQNKEEVK